jgi:hypothetical protein
MRFLQRDDRLVDLAGGVHEDGSLIGVLLEEGRQSLRLRTADLAPEEATGAGQDLSLPPTASVRELVPLLRA